jgi:hypothetical protein
MNTLHVCNGGHGCAGHDCACPCHYDTPEPDCCLFCGPGPHLMGCPQFDQGDHELVVQAVLGESDAVCEGCGADPRVSFEDGASALDRALVFDEWYIALDLSDPAAITADVLCPACLLTERFAIKTTDGAR